MGWRKELRKRRKLARVEKKELYVSDAGYRASVDERRKKIISSAINVGTSLTKALVGGSIGKAIQSVKGINEGAITSTPSSREERIALDNKLTVGVAEQKNTTNGIDKKTLVYIGIAAIGLLLFSGK